MKLIYTLTAAGRRSLKCAERLRARLQFGSCQGVEHGSPGVGHAATEHAVLVTRTRHLSTLTLVWLLIDGVIGMTAGV